MFYAIAKKPRRWGVARFPDWLQALYGYALFAGGMYAVSVWSGDHEVSFMAYTVAWYVVIDLVCAVVR